MPGPLSRPDPEPFRKAQPFRETAPRSVHPEKLSEGATVDPKAHALRGPKHTGTLSPSDVDPHDLHSSSHATWFAVSDGGGLIANYDGGRIRIDNAIHEIAGSSLTLADDDTNYVHITSGGVVTSNTTGFPGNSWPMAEVTTADGDITAIADRRTIPDIDTGAAGTGNTLDQAYDQGGAGAGRTVTADSGRFKVTNDGTETTNLIANKSTLTIDGNDEVTVPVTLWVYLTSAGATDSLDGIGAGTEGQIVLLTPTAGKDITLVHDGTVTAGKKLMISGNADYLLDQDHDLAIAVYDATATVWNVTVARGHKQLKCIPFTATEEDAQVEVMLPRPGVCIGEPGEMGTVTGVRWKVGLGTAGVTGTMTVKLYADSAPNFPSETEIASVDITTEVEDDDISISGWVPGTDNWLRGKITAIHSGTAAKDVTGLFYFEVTAHK